MPKPAHEIPVWVGGQSERAIRRAVEKGDAYHAIGLTAETAGAVVERVRRDRPEQDFTVSLRTGWDPQGMEPGQIEREREAFEAAGIQHVVSAPWRNDLDDWLRSMDLLAGLVLENSGG
jgi:alkanesulfonate monooxygenase SsuD/methylene tetrahydromethanopterin reductase-like flavin-dependent oxidoreductase (luciferase family)